MIVLDQDHVVQSHPVIHASSDSHRRLFKFTQSRCGLPRIENGALGSFKRCHDLSSARSNTAHPLHKIECQPLPDENALGSPLDPKNALAHLHNIAIDAQQFTGQLRIHDIEDPLRHLQTGHNTRLFGHDPALLLQPVRQR